MNRKKSILLMLLVLYSLSLAQKHNFNETLKNIKNVKSVYLSDNSMLLKMNNNKVKLIDLVSNEVKDLNITTRFGIFSQAKNDIFLLTQTEKENNHYGILISRSGEKKTFPISTYFSKISENGQFIITFESDYDGGKFQVFDVNTLQELILPIDIYSSFVADFVDSNRVFVLYQGVGREHNNGDSYQKKIKSLLQKLKKEEITIDEYKKKKNELYEFYEIDKPKKRGGSYRNSKNNVNAKYLIYNIITEQVEVEREIIIDNTGYYCSNELYEIGISKDGNKVLVSAKTDRLSYHNRLIEIDMVTNKITDISSMFDLQNNDSIERISFVNDDDYVLSVSNKGKTKYFYSKENILFYAEREATAGYASTENMMLEGANIIIMDHKNKKYVWSYKNKNRLDVNLNSQPVFSTDGKMIKTYEVQK